MTLEPFLHPELALVLEERTTCENLFKQVCSRIQKVHPDCDSQQLLKALVEREASTSTVTPEGVAFPHAIIEGFPGASIVVITARDEVDFGPDQATPGIIFCLFGDAGKPWEHVRILARLARISHSEQARNRLRESSNPSELLQALLAEDRSHG